MAENNADLNIVLKLLDEASAQIAAAMGNVKKETEDVNKKSKESSNTITKGFKEANGQLRSFKSSLLIAGIAMGGIIATTKTWSERNQETKDAFDKLEVAGKNIAAMIGSLLAPAIIALADVVQQSMKYIQGLFEVIRAGWTSLFKGLTYGIQYVVSFFAAMQAGANVIDAHKIAINSASFAAEDMTKKFTAGMTQNIQSTDEAKKTLENYNNKLNDIGLLFKTGQISAQEYFSSVLSLNDKLMAQNDIIAQQTRSYIDLINEVSNTDLMNFQANIASKTEFFNAYKDMYIQGHADMFAFAGAMATQFHSLMSTALSDIILGEKSAKEAMADFGKAMVKAIVDYMTQQAVAWAVSMLMQGIITATSATMAATIASAWAPAAAMVSLATLGLNAPAAIAGMTTTTASAYALAAPKPMALGGSGTVSNPTLFLAGEAGPEHYSFTPLGAKGQSNGNTYIDIKIDRPTVSNRDDLDTLVEAISMRLSNEIERAR